MSCFANQILGGIRHSKSHCHVLSAKLNIVVPPWGVSQLEYSPQLALVGPWARKCAEKRSKKTGRPGKGLQRLVAFIGIPQGWDPPSFIFPSSPSPQWLMGGMPSFLLVLFALNLCCGVTISDHCLFSPLCLSTLSTGFLPPPPADVRVDYKAIQLKKLPGNNTNNRLNCFLCKNPNSGLNF